MNSRTRWEDYPTVSPTGTALVLRGRHFQPLAEQLMRMQLLWELGPRRGIRVPIGDFTDAVRVANPTEVSRVVERPEDIGQENYVVVNKYMNEALATVRLPARPINFIWCAEIADNMSYSDFFAELYRRQDKSSPTSHGDAAIIRDLVRDLHFVEP